MSQLDRDYAEKRDFIRMRVDADVSLIHEGHVIHATCVDLSSSGMQIDAPRKFQEGDQINVRIDSEHQALTGLAASTEVVWVNDLEDGGQKLGLRILEMK